MTLMLRDGWGGVGWGMLTFACTCVMTLMLRDGLVEVGHVNVRLPCAGGPELYHCVSSTN